MQLTNASYTAVNINKLLLQFSHYQVRPNLNYLLYRYVKFKLLNGFFTMKVMKVIADTETMRENLLFSTYKGLFG